MLQFQGGSCGVPRRNFKDHNGIGVLQDEEEEQQPSMKKAMDGGDWSWSGGGGEESSLKKTEDDDASRKHAFAERKRRKRINDHYNTLRLLFPNLPKRDKATLLTEAVRRVNELRKMVAEVAPRHDEDKCGGGITGGSPSFFFPGENDEATVNYYCDGTEGKTVKATVCCEDRPGLNRDITEAVRSVRGRAVRAEMSTIGGRTKAVVFVRWPEGGGGEEEVGELRRALKAVVEDRDLGSTANGLMGRVMNSSTWVGSGQDFQSGKRYRITTSMGDGLSDRLLLSCV